MDEYPVKEFITRWMAYINNGATAVDNKAIHYKRQPVQYLVDFLRSNISLAGIYVKERKLEYQIRDAQAMLTTLFAGAVKTLIERDGPSVEFPECLKPLIVFNGDRVTGGLDIDGLIHSEFVDNGEAWSLSGHELIPNVHLELGNTNYSVIIEMPRVPLFAEFYTSKTTTMRIIPDVSVARYYVIHLDYSKAECSAPGGNARVLNFCYFDLDDVVSVYGSKTIRAAFTTVKDTDVDADGNPSEELKSLHAEFVPYALVN